MFFLTFFDGDVATYFDITSKALLSVSINAASLAKNLDVPIYDRDTRCALSLCWRALDKNGDARVARTHCIFFIGYLLP